MSAGCVRTCGNWESNMRYPVGTPLDPDEGKPAMREFRALHFVCCVIEAIGWTATVGGPAATVVGVLTGPPLTFPLRGIDRPLFLVLFIVALVLSALPGLLLVTVGEAGRLFARMGDRLREISTLQRAEAARRTGQERGGPEWARLP